MNHILIFIIGTLLLFTGKIKAQEGLSTFFQSHEIMQVRLQFDLTKFLRQKPDEYQNGTFKWLSPEGDSIQKKIRLRARGNFRKKNCHFIPIMLNFKPDTLFTSDGYINKLKLVTHCHSGKVYSDNVLEEYLIYRLYELISPYSLKTRLWQIDYQDTGVKEKHCQHWGFVIEPMLHMTTRTKTVEVKAEYLKDGEINIVDADRVALFNYMVGNTDWRIVTRHNIKFIKRFGHRREEVSPIPYDFDHSGFVNASYAHPAEWSSAKHVTERDYTGRSRKSYNHYYGLIDEFLAIEEEAYRMVMEFEPLNIKARKRLHKYLKEFFDEIRKSERFVKFLVNDGMNRY